MSRSDAGKHRAEFDFELPHTSKWHKPACNRILKISGSWAEVEIFPSIIIKLNLCDLKIVMKYRWNLKRGRAQGILIVNGSEINGGRGQITLQKHILKGSKRQHACFRNSNDRLDFRRSNIELRNPTLKSIKQNKRKTPTTSIYRGVSLNSKTERWNAQICVDQRSMNLGTFDSEVEAALAYNQASRMHHGDDGYQNEINETDLEKCFFEDTFLTLKTYDAFVFCASSSIFHSYDLFAIVRPALDDVRQLAVRFCF